MNPFLQQLTIALAPALLPTFAVLIGMMANRNQIESLRNEIKTEFAAQREVWRAELRRVEEVLDARLRHLEER
jgi:hypothetical protein